MEENQKCPKCGGEIEEGVFLKEMTGYFDWFKSQNKIYWASKNGQRKDIKSFRCENCGYLESYAK